MFIPTAAKLTEYMHHSGFKSPEDVETGPFQYAHGVSHWKLLSQDPKHKANLDAYMSGRREGMPRWLDVYPAVEKIKATGEQDVDAVSIVDVGGGQGHDLQLFHDRHPDVRGRLVLQELPETLSNLTAPPGIETIPYDFFTPQPIQGKSKSPVCGS